MAHVFVPFVFFVSFVVKIGSPVPSPEERRIVAYAGGRLAKRPSPAK